jgi:ABC-type polysaccharide/polyol phosphate transport system ATPase subunit
MQKKIVAEINNLSKSFYTSTSVYDFVKIFFPNFYNVNKKKVLKDISFKIFEGETLGIVGRNGAGKTTLLRILSGTIEPSSGSYILNGSLSSILELGTGFHDDLTGRQNIIMGGLAMGIKRKVIEMKMQQIIDFSELEDVIDDKFSTYSSGMKARLTFSTAIANEPDILIVDEALSVGDAAFQVKCFNWFQKLKSQNKTILLVSHDTNTITKLCDKALLIENGEIAKFGDPFTVTNFYQKILFDSSKVKNETQTNIVDKKNKNLRYGNEKCFIYDFYIEDDNNTKVNLLRSSRKYNFIFLFEAKKNIKSVSYGFAFKDKQGTVVSGITNSSQNGKLDEVISLKKYKVKLEVKMNLYNGIYSVTFGLAEENGDKIDFLENAILFEVIEGKNQFTNSVVNFEPNIKILEI